MNENFFYNAGRLVMDYVENGEIEYPSVITPTRQAKAYKRICLQDTLKGELTSKELNAIRERSLACGERQRRKAYSESIRKQSEK